jgi:hypothetical protein
MKRWLFALAVLLAFPLLSAPSQSRGSTFYLQAIRGTDNDSPPTPEARPVGPVLRRRLQVFRWKSYWEIKRESVVVQPGGKTRQRMTADREVEIALPNPREMIVCLYVNGKLTRRRTQVIDTAFYIAGVENANDPPQSWFIIVRRDNPVDPPAN